MLKEVCGALFGGGGEDKPPELPEARAGFFGPASR